jgi:hypothetical protein
METFKVQNNIMPSMLPINTVIDDQEHGTFVKDAPGLWSELQYREAHEQKLVWDEGPTREEKFMNLGSTVIEMPSDVYFTDIKILSLPISVVEYIVEEFAKMTGSETVFEEAMEAAEK